MLLLVVYTLSQYSIFSLFTFCTTANIFFTKSAVYLQLQKLTFWNKHFIFAQCAARLGQKYPLEPNHQCRSYGSTYGYPKYPHKIWGPSAPPIFCGGASKFYYIAIVLKTRVKWRVMQISYLQQQFCAQLFLGTFYGYPKPPCQI